MRFLVRGWHAGVHPPVEFTSKPHNNVLVKFREARSESEPVTSIEEARPAARGLEGAS